MIELLERSKGNVFGWEMTGKLTAEEIEKAAASADERIKKYGKISWLVVMKGFKYASLKAMYKDTKWLMENLKHFDRMAIVGDKTWEEIIVKADGLVFGEKYFDISQLDEAWEWVEGGSE